MSRKILLIGGGGHCKSVLDTVLELQEYDEIGIIDKKDNIGDYILGIPVIGTDEDLPKLLEDGYMYAFITVGSIGNPLTRIKLYSQLSNLGFIIPNIIDKTAIVSKFAKLGMGNFIGKRSVVNADVEIQNGCIINSGCIVEHDCKIGSFVHIAPGTILGGEVIVRDNSHIGSNSSVKQQVQIGSNTIVGLGSVVLKDVNSNTMAFGNPCKEVRQL